MNISVLSNREHPVFNYLKEWCNAITRSEHTAQLCSDLSEIINTGDILFLVSYSDFVPNNLRQKFNICLVLHASNLPQGRGWSPHIWTILKGENEITISLIEAVEKIDNGDIWLQNKISLDGTELSGEINEKLFKAELDLMTRVVGQFQSIKPRSQSDIPATYFKKRTPEDSRLDLNKTILEQFNLLRVADQKRYPIFFDHLGHRYIVKIEKAKNE